jgi:hypothetical protein
VLVVIGLIVGGVLAGQSLIHAAQLRAIMSEKEKLETAVNTFRGKYNCLPGDCSNASTFFTGAPNGDGNGTIEYGPEGLFLIEHLQLAGLISGVSNPSDTTTYLCNGLPAVVPGFNIPASTYSAAGYMMFNVENEGANHCETAWNNDVYAPTQCGKTIILFSGQGSACGGHAWWAYGYLPAGLFPCSDIMALDTKYDDGFPWGGSLQLPGTAITGGQCYPNPLEYSALGTYGNYDGNTNGHNAFLFITGI